MRAPLSMWVLYDHPRDMPNSFVARRHEVRTGRSKATDDIIIGPTLEAVREQLPMGLVCFPRSPRDELHIVEVWL